jgi:hypothetical protein
VEGGVVREVSWNVVPRGRVVVGFGVLGGAGADSWKPETRESIVAGSRNISVERAGACLGVNWIIRTQRSARGYLFLTQEFSDTFMSNCAR